MKQFERVTRRQGGNTAAFEICSREEEHAHLRECAALNGNDAAQTHSFLCEALSITILVGLLSACYQHCLSLNHTQRELLPVHHFIQALPCTKRLWFDELCALQP